MALMATMAAMAMLVATGSTMSTGWWCKSRSLRLIGSIGDGSMDSVFVVSTLIKDYPISRKLNSLLTYPLSIYSASGT